MSRGKRVLLIVSGGIAAYKAPLLIRALKATDTEVSCILTQGGGQFVTPLTLASLSENKVYEDLFSLTDEHEMGHIELSRSADIVVVAPATADILAKMRAGIASDLATTVLLATDKPVMVAPAMNVRMWEHLATQANLAELAGQGIRVIGPEEGDMACGEFGMGRMAEPEIIAATIEDFFRSQGRLTGKRALVTSGPTHEPIDPARFISNRSSGRQGHAIARALVEHGAETVLISGPTNLSDPVGTEVHHVQSAGDMLRECKAALPADILVCAAAVADWRVKDISTQKIKKNGGPPALEMIENPDILATLSRAGNKRPKLVIGFAAETANIVTEARAKRERKKCDWIIANDVSMGSKTFSGADNTIHLIDGDGVEDWPTMSKAAVGMRLAGRIADHFETSA